MTTLRITRLLTLLSGVFAAGGLATFANDLGESLESTNLVWSTGGDNVWFGTNATVTPAFDGVDAAASGTIDNDQSSWLETTVTGPGELRFWWSCSTEEYYDLVYFYVNGVWTGYEISGQQDWQYVSYPITNAGPVTLRWVYSRDFDFGEGANKAYLDQVSFKTGPAIPLSTALNTETSPAEWTTGGNSNPTYWEGQTNFSRTDGMSAESGAIHTSQESWMETTVSNVASVSFWWKVSSVTNHGWLRFYTNNVQMFEITGEVGWQAKTNIVLAPGVTTLRWTCATDDLAFGKLNRGWVDEVILAPSLPATPITLGTPERLPDGQVQFNVNFEAGWPCKVYYSTNLASAGWTLLLTTNTTSAVTVITDAGASNSPCRFYRATSP